MGECAVLRLLPELLAEPSISEAGEAIEAGELVSDATARCMNFMVIRRFDMPFGVACGAIVGRPLTVFGAMVVSVDVIRGRCRSRVRIVSIPGIYAPSIQHAEAMISLQTS